MKWAYLHDKIIKMVHIYSVIHKNMYIKNDYFAQKLNYTQQERFIDLEVWTMVWEQQGKRPCDCIAFLCVLKVVQIEAVVAAF